LSPLFSTDAGKVRRSKQYSKAEKRMISDFPVRVFSESWFKLFSEYGEISPAKPPQQDARR
jgi:hypothetical protein